MHNKQLASATAQITYAVPAGGYNGALTSQFAETVSTYNGNNKLQWDVSPTGSFFVVAAPSTLHRAALAVWAATLGIEYGLTHDVYALAAAETVSGFALGCTGS